MSAEYVYDLCSYEEGVWVAFSWLRVSPEKVMVEDYASGPNIDEGGRITSADYIAAIDKKGARAILNLKGIEPGAYPTEALGVYLANLYKDNKAPVIDFIALANDAGIKPEVTCW